MSNEQSIGKAKGVFKATFLSAAHRLGCKGNGVWEWCEQSWASHHITRMQVQVVLCFPFFLKQL